MKAFPLAAASFSCAISLLFGSNAPAVTPTQSESFSGMYNATTFTEYDGVALYGSTNSGNFTSLTLPVFASAAANATVNLGPQTVQVPVSATNLRVAVFSVYGSASSSTVAMTFSTSFATTAVAGSGMAFTALFPDQTEATIATYIQGSAGGNSSAATALEAFFNEYSADFPQVTTNNTAAGTVVTFSNAAANGTAGLTLAPVPEPGADLMLLAAVGLIGVIASRRQKLGVVIH